MKIHIGDILTFPYETCTAQEVVIRVGDVDIETRELCSTGYGRSFIYMIEELDQGSYGTVSIRSKITRCVAALCEMK